MEFLMLSSVAMMVKAAENKHPVLTWHSFPHLSGLKNVSWQILNRCKASGLLTINTSWASATVFVILSQKTSYCSFWVTNDSEILTCGNAAEHRWCKCDFRICLFMVTQHTFKRFFSTKSVKIFFSKKVSFLNMQFRCKCSGILPLSSRTNMTVWWFPVLFSWYSLLFIWNLSWYTWY